MARFRGARCRASHRGQRCRQGFGAGFGEAAVWLSGSRPSSASAVKRQRAGPRVAGDPARATAGKSTRRSDAAEAPRGPGATVNLREGQQKLIDLKTDGSPTGDRAKIIDGRRVARTRYDS